MLELYSISKTIYDGKCVHRGFVFGQYYQTLKISSILSMVNMDYVSYYIKELKGLEKQPESRKRQIIENDNETRRRIYIEGDKAYTETYEGEREEEVGIGELVEYLSVIKKELGLSDEMLVDEEFENEMPKINYLRFGDINEDTKKLILSTKDMYSNEFGKLLEINFYKSYKKDNSTIKVFIHYWNDEIKDEVISLLGNEAIANKSKLIYSGSGNNWYGEANDGTKLILKNSATQTDQSNFIGAISFYPRL